MVATAMTYIIRHVHFNPMIEQVTNQVLEPLMSMQDAFFEADLEHARDDTLKIIKDCVEEVAGLKDAASKNVKSQSQIHFEETIEQLRKLYRSYLAHESQHGKAVKSHADVLALLETKILPELLWDDTGVAEAAGVGLVRPQPGRTTCGSGVGQKRNRWFSFC